MFNLRSCFLFFVLFPSLSFSEINRPINIVTPNSLYSVAKVASEYFGQLTRFRTPNIKIDNNEYLTLCKNNSDQQENYDLLFSLRPMRESEIIKCQNNKIMNIENFLLGYVVIVLAHSSNAQDIDLSQDWIYKSFAGNILSNGVLIKNPYIKWSQFSNLLPEIPIQVYTPSLESFEGNALINFIVKPECINNADLRIFYSSYDEIEKQCLLMRSDGKYIVYSRSISTVLQKIIEDPNTMSIINYNDFIANNQKLKTIFIEGISPTPDNIKNKTYTLSSPVFVYYRNNINNDNGLQDFINSLTGSNAIGENGYLIKQGGITIFPK